MSNENILTTILIIITFLYVILTGGIVYLSYKQNHNFLKAHYHDLLWRLMMDYRSPKMLLAIDTLWRLYRSPGGSIEDKYEKIWNKENILISKVSPAKQIGTASISLHHRRRIVSHFYSFLSGILEQGAIDEKAIYAHWSESDLQIIPKILIPIEKRIARKLWNESSDSDYSLLRLEKLYLRSKIYSPSINKKKK